MKRGKGGLGYGTKDGMGIWGNGRGERFCVTREVWTGMKGRAVDEGV